MSTYNDEFDPEVNAAELDERSERIGMALDAAHEQGYEDELDGGTCEDGLAARGWTGRAAQAYREGWQAGVLDSERFT